MKSDIHGRLMLPISQWLPSCQHLRLEFLQYLHPRTMNSTSKFHLNSLFDTTAWISDYTYGYLKPLISALLQLHLHPRLNTWIKWIEQSQLQDETRDIGVLGFGATNIKGLTVYCASLNTNRPCILVVNLFRTSDVIVYTCHYPEANLIHIR